MKDLISREALMNAIEGTDWYHVENGELVHGANSFLHQPWYKADDIYKAIKGIPDAEISNQVNLCDSCSYMYPACPSKETDVIFGNGKGNDNICACSQYDPAARNER